MRTTLVIVVISANSPVLGSVPKIKINELSVGSKTI